jgi:putative membrane protein
VREAILGRSEDANNEKKPRASSCKLLFYSMYYYWDASVIPEIFLSTLFFCIYTVLVILLDKHLTENHGLPMRIPDSLFQSITIVLGLLLVFRTNTAYDRFWEGRKLWSGMQEAIQNIMRMIWVCIPEKDEAHTRSKVEVLKLCVAFAVAVKHRLRREYGIQYTDLEGLLPAYVKNLPENKKTLHVDKAKVCVGPAHDLNEKMYVVMNLCVATQIDFY